VLYYPIGVLEEEVALCYSIKIPKVSS